jgi:hypothetical protein
MHVKTTRRGLGTFNVLRSGASSPRPLAIDAMCSGETWVAVPFVQSGIGSDEPRQKFTPPRFPSQRRRINCETTTYYN